MQISQNGSRDKIDKFIKQNHDSQVVKNVSARLV